MKRISLLLVLALIAVLSASAQMQVPASVTSGSALSIPTQGSGSATLLLFGPGSALTQKVELGQPIQIPADQIQAAGRYTVILRGGSDQTATFTVTPGKIDSVAFIARPSRVPAAKSGVVTGTAFLFDAKQNLVLQPSPVKFDLSVEGTQGGTRTETSKNGIAWTRMDSGKKEGAAQFTASAGGADVKRVVQQVASEPCTIRMRAQKAQNGNILVETDPIRDCAGNAVPDGTIVTFTSVDQNGKSTVDARIKRGIARAELPPAPNATLSVAAGVVLGNEIRWGGGQ